MSATVRDSTEGDVEAVLRIYAHYVLHSAATFEETVPPLEEMHRRRKDVLASGLPYLVAEVDGVVCGYAYAGQYRKERTAYRYTVEDSIYLDPERTGLGLGKLLLRALIEACEKLGRKQMLAVIGDSNNAASIGLHQSFGFRKVGTLERAGIKFGEWKDVVFMQRALGQEEEEKHA
ncbi:acetyltransferase [Acanthamoeba castellanii str. Neff]|uniref:Acetyltransferase n=1 Tax=Acanthamoeba castellanii (strain ATCC 30010 / Neff) TaxID=1257118 RepID=L8H6H1_ACACF|nr:acetyltransferase [Acanthamoeba castellanii str. Neff]ELR20745.1 acetyltransferase [Acanthamoeba castellanii str. Neff]